MQEEEIVYETESNGRDSRNILLVFDATKISEWRLIEIIKY